MAERGEIYNPTLANQIRSFKGLRYGKITPTDIDAFMEFGNKAFVIIEGKGKNAPLPYGQNLALERLCDAIQDKDRAHYSLLIVCEHVLKDDGVIDVGNSTVLKYRYGKKWHLKNWTVTQCVNDFLENHGINYEKHDSKNI